MKIDLFTTNPIKVSLIILISLSLLMACNPDETPTSPETERLSTTQAQNGAITTTSETESPQSSVTVTRQTPSTAITDDSNTNQADGIQLTPSPLPTATPSPTPAPFSDTPGFEVVGHLGGVVSAMAVQNNYAYIGQGPELAVLDISDPTQPARVGYTIMPDAIHKIYASENHLYLTTNTGSDIALTLWVIDITDPTQPAVVSRYQTITLFQQFAGIKDNIAYLAAGAGGLHLVDVSDPTQLTEITTYQTIWEATQLVIEGERAYIGLASPDYPHNYGLQIVDISTPTQPLNLGLYKTDQPILDLAAVENMVYLLPQGSAYQIIDVSDPTTPFAVNTANSPQPNWQDITLNQVLYLNLSGQGQSKLLMVDIKNPAQSLQYLYATVTDIVHQENYLYIATGSGGLQILDVNTPAIPRTVGSYQPDITQLVGLTKDLAYVTGRRGLHIIDTSNPTQPQVLATYPLPAAPENATIADDKIFIILETETDTGAKEKTLHLVDISNAANPQELSRYPLPVEAKDIAVKETYAYITTSQNGLHILDISDPTVPTLLQVYEEIGYSSQIIIKENIAYLLDSGLHLLDISQPETPLKIGYYPGIWRIIETDPPFVYGISTRLYGESTLKYMFNMIDFTNPTIPTAITSTPNTYDLFQATIQNNNLYLVDRYGLQGLDISTPNQLIQTGRYQLPMDNPNIMQLDDYLYVADAINGLSILKANPVSPPQQQITAKMVGHIGGRMQSIFVHDKMAYLGSGPEMSILNMANPAQPQRVGYFILPTNRPSTIHAITVVESYAYLVDSTALWIVDLTDPSQPQLAGSTALTNSGQDIIVFGDYAYVAETWCSGRSGSGNICSGNMEAINIADPTNPFPMSNFKASSGSGGYNTGVKGVTVANNTLYIADSQEFGLRAIDISDPTNLVEMGNSGGGSGDVVIKDNLAYITNGYWGDFRVIDIADPTTLNTLSIYDTAYETEDIAMADSYVYFAETASTYNNPARLGTGLHILNIADPQNLVSAGFYSTTSPIRDLTIAGDILYLITQDDELHILDITNRTTPHKITTYRTLKAAYDIITDGNIAHVGIAQPDRSGYRTQTIDVTKPQQPTLIQIEDDAPWPLKTKTIETNTYTYIISGNTLQILDKATASPLSTYQASGTVRNSIISNNYAYLLTTRSSTRWVLEVVDISSAASPSQINLHPLIQVSYSSDKTTMDMLQIKNYLYFSNPKNGLHIFDLANPANPQEVQTVPHLTGGHMALQDNYLYLAGSEAGLQILNVDNPAAPEVVGILQVGLLGTTWSTIDLAVEGGYAYLLDDQLPVQTQEVNTAPYLPSYRTGLRIIDISNPIYPTETGFAILPQNATYLAAIDGNILISAQTGGLYLYQQTADLAGGQPTTSTPPVPPTTTPTTSPAPTPVRDTLPAIDLPTFEFDVENIEATLVNHLGGLARAIHLEGDFAYLGISNQFAILNISDPTQPQRVGYTLLPSDIINLTVEDNFAYIVLEEGLAILDIADKNAPRFIHFQPADYYHPLRETAGIAVHANHLYLGQPKGVSVLDISTPTNPVEVGYYSVNNDFSFLTINYLTIIDDVLYVAENKTVHILDIKDPTNPTLISMTSTVDPIFNLQVRDNILYLAANNAGLITFDITDPETPIYLGQNREVTVRSLILAGDYAYADDQFETTDRLHIFDITQPAHPQLVGDFSSGALNQLALANNYLYLATVAEGLQVLDITQPTAPRQVGQYGSLSKVGEVVTNNGYVYTINNGKELRIFSLNNPSSPQLITDAYLLSLTEKSYVNCYQLYPIANEIYAACGEAGLKRVDVTNLNQLVIQTVYTGTYVYDVVVAGQYAYLAAGSSGVQILNISNPANPQAVGNYQHPYQNNILSIVLEETHLLASDFTQGLQTIDVSNPANPIRLKADLEAASPNNITSKIAGNYLYYSRGEAGLYIFELSGDVEALIPPPIAAPSSNLPFNLPFNEESGFYRSTSPGFALNETLVASQGEGQPLHRSIDGGQTWAEWIPPIAFVSDRGGNRDIYLRQSTVDNRQTIIPLTVNPAADENPAWSPGWTRVVFQSNRTGNWDIFSIRAECDWNHPEAEVRCDLQQLTTDSADNLLPVWSPDGRFIAFVSTRNGNPEIYLMNINGDNQRQLTFNPTGDWRPAWVSSETGQAILFTSDRNGQNDIFQMTIPAINNAFTTEPPLTPLIVPPTDDRDPATAPTSQAFYFLSGADGQFNGYVYNYEAGTTLPLAIDTSIAHPAATIDGLLVAVEQNGDSDIYYFNTGDNSFSPLIVNPGFDGQPAWGPVFEKGD